MTEVSLAARANSSTGPSSLELLTTEVKDGLRGWGWKLGSSEVSRDMKRWRGGGASVDGSVNNGKGENGIFFGNTEVEGSEIEVLIC